MWSKLDWLEIEVRRLAAENTWNHEARRLLLEGKSRLSTVESDVVKLSADIVSTRREVEEISAMTATYLLDKSLCDQEGGNETGASTFDDKPDKANITAQGVTTKDHLNGLPRPDIAPAWYIPDEKP